MLIDVERKSWIEEAYNFFSWSFMHLVITALYNILSQIAITMSYTWLVNFQEI